MKPTLALALQPSVVKRAIKCAVVVGAILIAINHGPALLRGDVPPTRLSRMVLTLLVPSLVPPFPAWGRWGRPGINRHCRMSQ